MSALDERPLARTQRLCTPEGWSAILSGLSPDRTSQNPGEDRSPSRLSTPGCRKSADTRIVRLPAWPSITARFVATALFPSPVAGLVTISVFDFDAPASIM